MVNSKKFKIIPVSFDQLGDWNDLVKNSEQSSIFFLDDYLRCTGREYLLYFIYKGNEIKAGVALILSSDRLKVVLDDLVIYSGLVFRNDLTQKKVKSLQEKFEITEFVLAELDKKFKSIEIAFHPSLKDIRPLLWYNYHTPELGRYIVELRYTSFIDISEFFLKRAEEHMSLFSELENSRQSDIRKARRDRVLVEQGNCVDLFIEFYSKLMGRQNQIFGSDKKERMQILIGNLIESEQARLFYVRNQSGEITYITIFTLYNHQACYLFGAGDSDRATKYDGTICVWESFRQLANYGIEAVDLEGVNSPQRGWFKLSFGGTLVPYYQVYKAAQNA